MTHEETIKRIQKLVPSVMALEFGCEVIGGAFNKPMIYRNFAPDDSQYGNGDLGHYLIYKDKVGGAFSLEKPKNIIGHPITLAIVLLALDINSTDSRWKIGVSCNFMRIQFGESFALWNLSKDNFNDQSEETKSFIGGLLGTERV